jgi:hypothetical protein
VFLAETFASQANARTSVTRRFQRLINVVANTPKEQEHIRYLPEDLEGRTMKVTEIDRNPIYRYNPAYRFKRRSFQAAVHNPAGTEQPGRQHLDKPLGRGLWDPRHSVSGKGL